MKVAVLLAIALSVLFMSAGSASRWRCPRRPPPTTDSFLFLQDQLQATMVQAKKAA
jgi:hypothetical protein